MQTNNEKCPVSGRHILFEKTSTYKVVLQNANSKETIAVVNRSFAPDGKESLYKVIEKLIKAIDLNEN